MKGTMPFLSECLMSLMLFCASCNPVGSSVAASQLSRDHSPEVDTFEIEELVAGNNHFAFAVIEKLYSQDANLVYSPFSITLALAMAYAGARNETADQMAGTLNITLDPNRFHPAFNALDMDVSQRASQLVEVDDEDNFELNIVNAMWGQEDWPFLPDFLDLLAVNYGAGMRLVDFMSDHEQARNSINDWVSNQTRKRIKELVPQGALDPMTRLVLVNAIYFNATWEYPFDADRTSDGPFTLLDDSQVIVPMMGMADSARLAYGSGEGWQAVALPYAGGLTEMVVLVPDLGNFPVFMESLDQEYFDTILSEMEIQDVEISMPKFTFEGQFELAGVLSEMGMPNAFDSRADFSGIDGQRDLFISRVIHKAFIAVDEKGTEAAAATAVVFRMTAAPVGGIVINVDRPFLFIIRDVPTGSILFMGTLTQP